MRVRYSVTKPEDLIRLGVIIYDESRPIGWTAWAGRRAVAIGGVIVRPGDRTWGHFGATEDYRPQIISSLHRRTIKLLRRLAKAGVGEIYATCDTDVPRAIEWMKRLGFEPTGEEAAGLSVHVRRASTGYQGRMA